MPLRSSRKAQQSLQRASVETLENRTLLTAIVNGLFTDTGTFFDGQPFFEYKQADDTVIRISVQGNITAEFIGARVPDASFDVILRDLIPAGSEEDGVDLFSIYVVAADSNSIISIAQVPDPQTPERPMMPFDGNAGSLTISNANTGEIEQVDLGTATGAVYIGARTHDFEDEDLNDIPIITPSDNRRIFGLRPSSAGQLYSGLELAPGTNLGRFMLGGTITGLVDISGSMRMFYAGNILTGDPGGIGERSPTPLPRNFYVGGDLENLIVGGSFGTVTLDDESENLDDIDYKTGFDLHVRGRLGQMLAIDSFLGNAHVANDARILGLGLAQTEVELRGPELEGSTSYFDPVFGVGEVGLGDQLPATDYFNDGFDSAQYLGTLFSSELDGNEVIQLRGYTFGDAEVNDHVDYYAVALLAGQTAQVQLLETTYRVAVFDPDGRLIASDYSSNEAVVSRINTPFRFTADRPGAYRIAIARPGDVNFNGVTDDGESVTTVLPRLDYELRVSRVADIALGGIIADHVATTDAFSSSITVERGDLGQVRAGILGGAVFSFSAPWTVSAGNLRSIEANTIGLLQENTFSDGSGVDFIVPRGSVGLIRTFGTDDQNSILVLNDDYSFANGGLQVITPLDDITLIDPSLAVGVDIQLVESFSNLNGNLLANRGIGVIRTVNVRSNLGTGAPVWAVNVDNRGEDGVIDLVEVSGQMGELGPGGPAIATGPGGNVRYIHVPSGNLFIDPFFGGGLPQVTLFEPGETAHLVDDNGTEFTITPTPNVRAVDPNTGLPLPTLDNPGVLQVLSYPIRDKAGLAVVDVTVQPFTPGTPGRGVSVRTGARGSRGSVEIANIEVRSQGTDLTFDPFERTFVPEPTNDTTGQGQNSDVLLDGGSNIDVWSVEVVDPVGGTPTGLTRIGNGTRGEIVNVTASAIGSIVAETIGLAKSHTGTAVEGAAVRANFYPFNQQRNLVLATGGPGLAHIASLQARRGLGNIVADGGSIGTVFANSDRRSISGVHEGINAPILAVQNAAPDPQQGNIITVFIGEGVLPSGTGDVGFAGLYADSQIDLVRNTGLDSDIRGDIVARGLSLPTTRTVNGVVETSPNWIINQIVLDDGAIIDADILTVNDYEDAKENDGGISIPQRTDPVNNPIFDIGSIEIGGIGGIIGSFIAAEDIGPIVIDGGFGLITSVVSSLGDSTIDGVITDGYGLRTSIIDGGANLNFIQARGTGKRIATTWYTPTVRYSERMSFDPYSGLLIDGGNDLHAYLGTSRTSPKRVGYSDSGVIEDTQIVGSRNAGVIEAHRIIGRNVFFNDANGRRRRTPFGSLAYPMRISFGNGVDTIRTRDVIDGLALTGGGVNLFTPGNDVHYTAINVTGRIRDIIAGGALRGTTSIKARGPEGTIDNITTRRSLYAHVESSLDLGQMNVGTYLGSPNIDVGRNLGTLRVGRSVVEDAFVDVSRTLNNLIVRGDVGEGTTIRADAIVNQDIGGQVLGDIIIV